jgi:TP901 family phage tail tape measure protein
MSQQTIQYIINISGNATNAVQAIATNVGALNNSVNQTTNIFQTFSGRVAVFNQMAEGLERAGNALGNVNAPGIALESSLADLSAITGQTGEGLEQIEGYARDMATAFGGSAAQGVESFKLLLSQLTPELAKQPAALKAMGENVAILSKTMGGNTTAAAEVLTTAMNQFQVSTDDPIEASQKMAEMMNTMAAAAKEGSAELPQIKAALEQSGMAAKAAGVSFEETNAAIQVLDKAGKKGSEGGVALRNVMSTLAQGRFLPKDVQEELSAAGVNVSTLGDKSKSLSERLRALHPVMQDDALMAKLFGKENSAAALALLSGTDAMDGFTSAITGTTTAQDQAAVIMESTSEKMARMKAKVDDLKVGFFNLTGSAYPYVDIAAQSAVQVAQMMPLFMGLGKAIMFVTNMEKLKSVWDGILAAKTWLVGIATATSAGIATGATTVWTAAQTALNVAMAANPIGLIVVAVAALIGLIYVCIKHFETWGATVMFLMGPVGWIVNAVMALKNNWDSVAKAFQEDGILAGLKRIGVVLLDTILYPVQQLLEMLAKIPGLGNLAGKGAEKLANLRASFNLVTPEKKKEAAEDAVSDPATIVVADLPKGIEVPKLPGAAPTSSTGSPNPNGTSGNPVRHSTEAVATGGTRNTQITVNLGKMMDNMVFNGSVAENRQEIEQQMREMVVRLFYGAAATAGG